jgi:heme/copper-type cytochrome/quinol oxidase subunit 3
VLGQANEYRMLVHEGIKINTDGYGSMFFLATGFHGLHVIGGLLAFIIYMIRTTMGRFTPAQDGGDRGVLLLALRRHCVDRSVLHDLFAPVMRFRRPDASTLTNCVRKSQSKIT